MGMRTPTASLLNTILKHPFKNSSSPTLICLIEVYTQRSKKRIKWKLFENNEGVMSMISRYHFYLSFFTPAILFELQNLHFALKFILSLTFLQGDADFLYWLAEWLGVTNRPLCQASALYTVASTSIIFSLAKIVLLFFRQNSRAWRWKRYISCKTIPFRPICFSCS